MFSFQFNLRYYFLRLCLPTYTTSTSLSITPCQNPGCAYGQSYDSVNCKCTCLPGFAGTLCDEIDCAIANDSIVCNNFLTRCVSDYEKGICPFVCGI